MRWTDRLAATGFAVVIGWASLSSAQPAPLGEVVFEQVCDASAVVVLTDGRLLVAEDMSDVLQVYAPTGGAPVAQHDLYPHTGTPKRARQNTSAFEGMARQGDEIYVVTSHAREQKGKNRPNQRRLLALKSVPKDGGEELAPVGIAYTALKQQLTSSKALASLNLLGATMEMRRQLPHLAPQNQGLNIEGLAAGPNGSLLLGLRNPRRQDLAAVIPIRNPERVVLGMADPDFGPPQRLDLARFGIASFDWSPKDERFYLVAAAHDVPGGTRLYRWSGRDGEKPELLSEALPPDYDAQGLALSNDGARLIVVSDDGARPMQVASQEQCGRPLLPDGRCTCSFLADPARRQFRGRWLAVPPIAAAPAAAAGASSAAAGIPAAGAASAKP